MSHGGKREGAGRPKGSGNKKDELARRAISKFVERNTEKFDAWLDEIYAEKGAQAAFDCVKDLIEYHKDNTFFSFNLLIVYEIPQHKIGNYQKHNKVCKH